MTSSLSVIIPAQNEADTIGEVVAEAQRLSPLEIIVVANGSSDRTKEICLSKGCAVYEYAQALGNDVGRSVGAYHAKGSILLFLDGDIPIPHAQLLPFVRAIEQGYDIALNEMNWSLLLSPIPHYTAAAKVAFNRMLRRPELGANSLVAVPHAMSKKAVDAIGFENLSNPCFAQAIASLKQLSFVCPASVDVIRQNKLRPAHSARSEHSVYPKSTTRIIGDHLEALHFMTGRLGPRGEFSEGIRDRGFLRHYVPPSAKTKAKRSAVIPVMEEGRTIKDVVRSVRAAGVDEIIVVANGADDRTVRGAMEAGARVMVFGRPLGHNVGRAIGAACSTGDVCLFVDGDFVVPPQDLVPFIQAVEQGADVAFNDMETLFRRFRPVDPISAVKYFLNICLGKPELLNNSLTAVPHALSRTILSRIGCDCLVIPPLAQAKAALAGCRLQAAHAVDVVTPNRPRTDHAAEGNRIPAFERIIGDHLEAIDYLLRLKGPRGGFPDTERNAAAISFLKGKGT
ncbi:hypothetical protein SD70_26170 [Gordoniibacillus kamchatkensis]|uniref:Glycosyltransferase 2-like domain-containing protein n=1 Tax=Gordoniibacillus kamchatkensis TaxID=1590651 RepID=A0ABR5ADI0_9BACL|nr:glycosyltransferase [Paenibacillus sp. VKM B-2647]KIL38457.1 hypothetical protein SD70_26170 [Paenibacillus sp. VKM B-2647]